MTRSATQRLQASEARPQQASNTARLRPFSSMSCQLNDAHTISCTAPVCLKTPAAQQLVRGALAMWKGPNEMHQPGPTIKDADPSQRPTVGFDGHCGPHSWSGIFEEKVHPQEGGPLSRPDQDVKALRRIAVMACTTMGTW